MIDNFFPLLPNAASPAPFQTPGPSQRQILKVSTSSTVILTAFIHVTPELTALQQLHIICPFL